MRERIGNEIKDMAVLAMFGAMMVASDMLTNILPNVHLIAMFTILLTRFYRAKALLSVYVFVVADGIIEGFFVSTWISYSYVWLILWAAVMLLPKRLSKKNELWIYPLCGGLHGLLFGILTSPASFFMTFPASQQSFRNYIRYIEAGLSFDLIHMAGNIAVCFLVVPLLGLMTGLRKKKLL